MTLLETVMCHGCGDQTPDPWDCPHDMWFCPRCAVDPACDGCHNPRTALP